MKRTIFLCAALVCAAVLTVLSLKNAEQKEAYLYALKGLSYQAELCISDAGAGNADAYEQHYASFLKSVGAVQQAQWGIHGGGSEKAREYLSRASYIDSLLSGPALPEDPAEFGLAKRYFEILSHSLTNADSLGKLTKRLDADKDAAEWVTEHQAYAGISPAQTG